MAFLGLGMRVFQPLANIFSMNGTQHMMKYLACQAICLVYLYPVVAVNAPTPVVHWISLTAVVH